MVGVFFINFRHPEILNQLLTYPLYILSGLAVPIDLFPKYFRSTARMLPLYWAQESYSALLVHKESFRSLFVLLLLGLFYIFVGWIILKKVERRARMDGKFCQILSNKGYFWKQEIILASKNLFYLFPPKLYLPAWLIQVVSEIIFFSLLGYTAMGKEGAYFALIGNATAAVTRSIMSRGSGLIANEKWMGTLAYVVVANFKFLRFMIGRNTINLIEGLLTSFSILVVLSFTLNLLEGKNYLVLWYIPILFLIALSAIGVSTIIAGVTFYVRTSMYVSSALWRVFMITCGVVFPLSYLPDTVQRISFYLPLTNGIMAMRILIDEAINLAFFKYLLGELLIGIGYLLAGTVLMKLIIKIALKKGTIEVF